MTARLTARQIALFAATLVAILTIADLLVLRWTGSGNRFWYTGAIRIGLFLLVALSSGVTARRFGWWSEHLGRAWGLFAIAYAVLCASEIVKRFVPGQRGTQELLLGAANVALIGAYWMMARSFRVAGLRYFGSPTRKILFIAGALILSVFLVQGSILSAAHTLMTQDPRPGQLLSAVADLITFLLAAPLLLMAFSLRGGHLFWTFGLLTAGTFGWMFNQAAGRLFASAAWSGAVVAGRDFGFAMACCFIAAAAVVQWLEVIRGTEGMVASA